MSNYLIHYASEYYDPVKAHQYYEEHKKLKGRRSTSSLNEEGKSAAEYLKEQVNTKRDNDIATEKSNKETKIDNAKAIKDRSIEAYTSRVNTAITRIQTKLKNMSSAEKARNYETLNSEIARLKADNQTKKAQLQAKYGTDKASIQSDYSSNVEQIKSQYENLYLDELDKIKSEAKYQKTTTTKSESKSKSTASSTKLPAADIDAYRKKYRATAGVKYK